MADNPQPSLDSRNAIMLAVRALEALNTTFAAILPSFGTTSASATAGSATLPSNPVTFINVEINGVSYKIPAYNP